MEIKDVENLAELAKIELSEEEKKQVLADMGNILDYVKIIESVDVSEIEPDYSHRNIWRDDVLPENGGDFSREEIISQFPDSKDDFVKVKKIL